MPRHVFGIKKTQKGKREKIMENHQFFILIGMFAVGFSSMIMWIRSIEHRLNNLEIRVTLIDFEIQIIEYQLEKELGQRELSKLRESISN